MNSYRPSPIQERWLVFAARWPAYKDRASVTAGIGGWTTVTLLTRCAFFLLGLIAAIATSAILAIAFRSHFAIVAGFVLVIAGECLIIGKRLFAAGAEEALVVTGYVLVAVGFTTIDNSSNDTAVGFGVAVALILSGLRLLNPLLTCVGAVTFSFAIAFAMGFGIFHSSSATSEVDLWVSLYCYGVAIVSLLAGAIQLQRPSYDRMLDWLGIVMPVVGYAWSLDYSSNGFSWGQQAPMHWYILLMPMLFATASIGLGIRRRTHAPMFAAMGCIACVAYELRNLTGMPLQWRLIMWGSLMLVGSSIAERLLREARSGITSRQLVDNNPLLDAAEIAGTALITPADKHVATESPSSMEGGGGSFSGGGATGKY